MSDLDERFRSLGRTRVPDLWQEIGAREPRHGPGPGTGGRIVAGAVALLVATAGVGLATWAFRAGERELRPTTTVTNGLLAFASGGDVWVVHPDGSGLTNVTNTRRPADAPDGCTYEVPWEWSPDGSRLAFYGSCDPTGSEGGANYDVFVMDADGRGRVNLTTSPEDVESGASQLNPHWSPDGTQITFDGDDGLYIVSAEGSGLHKVADGSGSTWSPDGTRVAFVGDGGIYTADPDGSDPTQVTSGPGREDLPAWSPAGDLIAFIAWSKEGGHQLEVVSPDGGGRRRLTDLPNDVMGSPSWSPDGSRIAVAVHGPGGSWDLYVVNADGSGVTQLTDGPGDESRPTWSPDGTKIAFMGSLSNESTNSGTFDVYTIDPDGTELTRITDGPGAAPGALTWQPVLVREDATPSPSPTTPPVDGSISAIDGFLPEGRLLVQVDGQHVELLEEGAETSTLIGRDLIALDLSPDGSRALVTAPFESGGTDTPLLVIEMSSGERTPIADLDGWAIPARWSPDGSSIAMRIGERHTLCIRELNLGEPRCLPELGRVLAFDWSPDGTRLVFEGGGLPGSLTILDVGTEQTPVLVRWDDPAVLAAVAEAGLGEPVAIQFQGPQWSPSGRYVAALGMVRTEEGHSGNAVLVFDMNGGVVARGVPFGEFSEARGWSPTADVFAYASGEPPYRIVEARLLDVSTGDDRLLASTADVGNRTIGSIAWSPSGRWIAFVAVTATGDGFFASEIQVLDTRGIEPPRIFEADGLPELVDWAP